MFTFSDRCDTIIQVKITSEVCMYKKFLGMTSDGDYGYAYTIKNENCELTVSNYGARVMSFVCYGKNIIGGFDVFESYFTDDSHQGGTIGRVANRIAGACFTMDGKEYHLPKNNGENCLHGGVGFDFRTWDVLDKGEDYITFAYLSEDGEEGFPNSVSVIVHYALVGNELIIKYTADPSGRTPISLTNHSYFNLDGFGGDILSHRLTVYADRYTEVGEDLIPTGVRPEVKGTPFDFTTAHTVGERIDETDGGYDHNYILCPTVFRDFFGTRLGLAAVLEGESLKMSVYTDQPGVQLYTGNFLGDGPDFKGGIKQIKHGALCLETQTEPNSVNHGIGFYNVGEVYTQMTVYSFEKNG